MNDEPDGLSHLIGQRIAARRGALALSLEEIALRTGVSRAMVSRIERGEVHASAVLLDKLCAGLGLSLSALFARDVAAPLLRRADQPVWQDPASGYIRREVAPAGTGSRVKIVEVEFPPGAEVTYAPSHGRVIDQHIWVLKGSIEVTLSPASGAAASRAAVSYLLRKGDCLQMRVADGNSFRNTGDKTARYAVIVTQETAA
ncbi:MAG TPA: XRE family transcriptional regulator [Dongiaceae bacterium]|nr:XRE family transcriptional regulator [Dongiaceae bacterium]